MTDDKKSATHEEFKAALATAVSTAASQSVEDACATLLSHEKKTRIAGDAYATADACVALVTMLWDRKDLAALNAHILIVSKRRSQLKQAITAMVQKVMEFVPELPDDDARVELLGTLRTVTEGKIYVEVERARLTMQLSKILEARGKIAEASETLQEVAVETFSSMEKKEKAEFLLEQTRLCLAQRDFVRMQIISNKVSKKVLEEDGFEDVKLRFYHLLLELHGHQKDTAALRADWQSIYNTKSVKEDESKWQMALQSITVYLALSVYGNETSDMEHRVLQDKNIDKLPAYKSLLTQLTTPEIIPWPLPADADLRAHPVLAVEEWHDMLHKRIVQHNIRIISQYYTRIRFDRLSSLLSLEQKDTETALSEMVSEKFIYAKIDRPAGIVSFTRKKPAEEVLAEWSSDVSTLLGLVEKTCHLINKENMVYGITS